MKLQYFMQHNGVLQILNENNEILKQYIIHGKLKTSYERLQLKSSFVERIRSSKQIFTFNLA